MLPEDSDQLEADQAIYLNPGLNQWFSPTWKHRNCQGRVYSTTGSVFACSHCKKRGEIGLSVPDGLSRTEQMEYLLTEANEVDLI